MGSPKVTESQDSGCGRSIAIFFWIFYVRDVGVAGSNPVTSTTDFMVRSDRIASRFQVLEVQGSKNGSSFDTKKHLDLLAVLRPQWTNKYARTSSRGRALARRVSSGERDKKIHPRGVLLPRNSWRLLL
jgi:hypothetical protein